MTNSNNLNLSDIEEISEMIGDKILIKPLPQDEYRGSIYIPEATREYKDLGTIVAISKKIAESKRNTLEVGDTVCIMPNILFNEEEGGALFHWKGEDYYLVREREIWGIVE